MDWYDIDDVLYDGNKLQMEGLRCPDCGGHISYRYYKGRFEKKCTSCGAINVDSGAPEPNCVKFFGKEHVFA